MAGSKKQWTFRLRIHPLIAFLLLLALWVQVSPGSQLQFCFDVVLLWLLLPEGESEEKEHIDD